MADFPTLSFADVTLCPFTHTVETRTEVIRFESDKEQRWQSGPVLHHWVLNLSDISRADMVLVQNFFITMKGAFDATWNLTIAGATYQKMQFDDDQLVFLESRNGLYSASIKVRQTQPNP